MEGRKVTLLDAYKLWRSLREVEDSRITGAYRRGECLALRLRAGQEKWLLFHPRIGPVLSADIPFAAESYTALKSAFRGRRVLEAALLGGDRVLALRTHNAQLVLEWIREGNVIVVEDSKIKYALRRRRMRDRAVELGAPYVPPPRRPSLFETSPEEVFEKLRTFSSRRLVTAFAAATSVPGDVAYEALYRVGLDPTSKARLAPQDLVEKAYWEARNIYVDALSTDDGFLVGRDVYPFMPTHVALPMRRVNYLEEASKYFAERISAACTPPEEGERLGERLRGSLEKVESEIRLLEKNRERVDALITAYRALRSARVPWGDIESRLRQSFPELKTVKHEKMLLEVEYDGVTIELDARQSFYGNLSEKYRALKRLKERIARAEAAYRPPSSGPEQRPTSRRKRWYEDFRYFTTTGGFLVVAGKSAGQNELLVRRYLEERDLFFHADIHGAPATILKSGGKEPGSRDIEEAAQFAASYSSAWEAGLYSIDVYWVRGSQVSKKAPSGEYLGKGAFMIYGKRNYLKGVKLSLAIGYNASEGIHALPALALDEREGCFLILEPGRLSRRLVVEKTIRFLRSHCGVKRIQSGDVEKLLPKGGFYIARKVVRGKPDEE